MRISQLRHKASCISNMNFSAGKTLGCIFPQIIFTEAGKALRILSVFRSVISSVQYSSTDGCSVGLNDLSVLSYSAEFAEQPDLKHGRHLYQTCDVMSALSVHQPLR